MDVASVDDCASLAFDKGTPGLAFTDAAPASPFSLTCTRDDDAPTALPDLDPYLRREAHDDLAVSTGRDACGPACVIPFTPSPSSHPFSPQTPSAHCPQTLPLG